MSFARAVGFVFFGAIGAALIGVVALRWHDGPLGPLPGGPLSGIPAAPPADWSAWADRDTVQLQVDPDSPRSVTTWFLVEAGRAYVPSGYPERKRWPAEVRRDGDVVLRADGSLYALHAVRVDDAELQARLAERLQGKYHRSFEDVWYFRLDPR